jgi:branched-chain amino acid transport system permease protein
MRQKGVEVRDHLTRLGRRAAVALAAMAVGAGLLLGGGAANAQAVPADITAGSSCQTDATTGCIQGTLRDDNGNGVKGVKVTAKDASGASDTATSNANGMYAFKVTTAGQYTLTLSDSSLPSGVKAKTPTLTVTATLGQLRPAVFTLTGHPKGSVSTTVQPPSIWKQIWDQFSQGLLLGLLLALASIGLSLTYGTTGLSNFAHAEQVTLGGLLAYSFGIALGLNLIVTAVIVIAICAFTGYIQDRFIWGPLRKRGLGLAQLMVVSIGLALALDYLFQFFYGSSVHPVSTAVHHIEGPLDLTAPAYWSMLISIIVLIAVGLALTRTRIGRATRAVADNRSLAAASGIDVDRIIRLVWTISMGLAGLSGILYALVYGGIQWSTGVQLLLLIFSAVTLGGIGTAFGALVGSLIIGIVVQMSSLVLSADLKYATALVIMIIILVVRPQGILGRKERVG